MIDMDFIDRCNKWAAPIAEELNRPAKEKRRAYSQSESFKISVKKYNKSEKGIVANKRKSSIYQKRLKDFRILLNAQEKEAIRLFYVNCPPGYEVDHIIPISRGGEHHIRNLQYLTLTQNRRKGANIDW